MGRTLESVRQGAVWRSNVVNNTFQWLIRQFEERMIVPSDTAKMSLLTFSCSRVK
jgi:hypothetical protein